MTHLGCAKLNRVNLRLSENAYHTNLNQFCLSDGQVLDQLVTVLSCNRLMQDL